MTTITRTFDVRPGPARVLDHLKDFTTTEEWDPGTVECTRNELGPIQVGSTFHNKSRIAGVSTELTYTLTDLTPERVVFEGVNESARTTDTITVVPSATGGSTITYEAVIEIEGLLGKLAAPAVKLLFERIGSETETQMTEVLNALDPAY